MCNTWQEVAVIYCKTEAEESEAATVQNPKKRMRTKRHARLIATMRMLIASVTTNSIHVQPSTTSKLRAIQARPVP